MADFSARKPPFGDRDLYVVCLGAGGIVTAHGGSDDVCAVGAYRAK